MTSGHVCGEVDDSGIHSQESISEPGKLEEKKRSLSAYDKAENRQPHGSHQQLFGSQNMQKPWKKDTKAFVFEDL